MADRIIVMNGGRIEQTGTPAEIYARPASAFVARFVGEMNMLDGVVAGPGRVRIAGLVLACAGLGTRPVGARVRLGLRPEEVRIRGVSADAPNALAVSVDPLDFLGPFCRATLHPVAAPGLAIQADLSANAVRDLGIREGQALTVALPPELLRVFDAGTEEGS